MNRVDDDTKETVTFRAVSRDEEGRKRAEKAEVDSHNVDTLKYIEKKLIDKGVQRQVRSRGKAYLGGSQGHCGE